MFIQIHMLQSIPPGNLNRDETGQPKKCIFGGVTRGRISSQCLKRNIRHSDQFKEAFPGEERATRTTYLPRMVADELRKLKPEIPDDELDKVKAVLASKFKSEKRGSDSEDVEGNGKTQSQPQNSTFTDQTGQVVFFPPPFANKIAKLIADKITTNNDVYMAWINGKKKDKDKCKDEIEKLEKEIFKMSQTLTVDIGLFGRMTTSDLVANVEAACQVAHAISTHETVIESDYFTAEDEKKKEFAPTQTAQTGAGFVGSGETETFFDSAVYYKYLNLDFDALKQHLHWQDNQTVKATRVLISAAALANPTGKQNAFAAHSVPELILVETSITKRPISYANAFLEPVDGRNLMTESAKALRQYIETVAIAFQPSSVGRVYLAKGAASTDISGARRVETFDQLLDAVVALILPPNDGK